MKHLKHHRFAPDPFQRSALSLMAVLVVLTFFAANLQAMLWQSSDWLVSTVLPAVVIELTNDERADLDAPPLVRNETLNAAAQLKAQHMARNEYFSHYSPDGVSPWYWFDEAGYVYAHAGENLAIHFTDSSEVVEAWMNSPTHRENIVSSQYTEIGVGTAKGEFDGYDTVYVVQLFGTPGITAPNVVETPTPDATELALATPPQPVNEPVAEAPVETSVNEPVILAETDPVLVPESEPIATEPATEPLVPDSVNEEVVSAVEPVVATESPEPVETAVAADELSVRTALDEPAAAPVASQPADVVVVRSPLIATSSGLAVANFTQANDSHAGNTRASLATQPGTFLQLVYLLFGMLVLFLLTTSIVLEARQLHYIQVGYSFMLLIGMGGLWFLHTLMIEGAVIL